MSRMRPGLLCLLAGVPLLAAATEPGEWDFTASLNGTPIGEHRFSVTAAGDERRVVSEANFTVKLLGITAYRYRHKAVEQWRGDCLTGLIATTDEDGKSSEVRAGVDGGGLKVVTSSAENTLPGCVMTFAYWNPALRTKTRLLNAQTGVPENVRVSPMGSAAIEVRGLPVMATRWRISGPAAPIDVWYSAQGEWVGLDSALGAGRTLSYRLK